MIVTPMPPGAQGFNNEAWAQTYGASMDCFLSIFDGSSLFTSIQTANNIGFPYNEGTFNAKNSNIYEKAGGLQQVQYITSKDTIKEAREAEEAGDVQELRSLCLRGPIHIAGWGRTVTQRPTDPDPQNPRDNDDEHKTDRSTWKVGPLDVRWDEKRACWRAFNDLIADDEGKNLGTWVHSTNPDLTCGFPFLRGKMEDVWSVRKTIPGAGLGKTNDSEKSGTVCTKIESLVFQGVDDLVAQWDDVLIVFDECISGPTAICGGEATTTAELGIKTTSKFFASPFQVGPLAFTLGPPDDDVITGALYYEGDGPCGQWVPGISVSICDIGGDELTQLWNNDKNLSDAILSTCSAVDFNQGFILRINDTTKETADSDKDFASNSVKPAFEKIETWTDDIRVDIANEIAKAVFNAYQQ
jgi:hypothetical protein